METTFGQFLRSHREKAGLGLREFCTIIKMDPSSYSRFERDAVTPPTEDTLWRIAKALRIKRNSDEWMQLTAKAAVRRGEVPSDVLREARLVALLPAFFKKLRDAKDDDAQIARLARVLEGEV